ncbi:hypothetical protein SprV_0401652800 [Sparganum proliferum]
MVSLSQNEPYARCTGEIEGLDRNPHAVPVSPPDENAVQQEPAVRADVQAYCLLPRRKAAEGIDQEEAAFCAGSQNAEATLLSVVDSEGTQHFLTGYVVCFNAVLEVTKDNQLVCLQHCCQEGVQIFVAHAIQLVVSGLWREDLSVGYGDEFGSSKRQAQGHETVVDALRQTGR